MTDEPAEIIYAADRKHRVIIFRRPSGSYGYREERHYKNDPAGTEGWGSLSGRSSHYEDLETAKREVVENVAWLATARGSPTHKLGPHQLPDDLRKVRSSPRNVWQG